MREVTKLMINDYKIKKLRCDFMGYKVDRIDSLQFHHLIIPRRECSSRIIPADGYVSWNGAILTDCSHRYLHQIERISPEIFYEITSEMIDENVSGALSIENLVNIRNLLLEFEKYHLHDRTKKNHRVVPPEAVRNRLTDEEFEEKFQKVKKMY